MYSVLVGTASFCYLMVSEPFAEAVGKQVQFLTLQTRLCGSLSIVAAHDPHVSCPMLAIHEK